MAARDCCNDSEDKIEECPTLYRESGELPSWKATKCQGYEFESLLCHLGTVWPRANRVF